MTTICPLTAATGRDNEPDMVAFGARRDLLDQATDVFATNLLD